MENKKSKVPLLAAAPPAVTPPAVVAEYVSAWQRSQFNQLPNLFEFHNEGTQFTERVSSYFISGQDLGFLDPGSPVPSGYNIRLVMGVDPNSARDKNNNFPDFTPILQGITNPKGDIFQNAKVMQVELGTPPMFKVQGIPIPGTLALGTTPTLYEQIPEKAAYLFATGWRREAQSALGECFEGQSHEQVIRVRHFTYDHKDSVAIWNAINRNLANATLHIYMGTGLALFPEHPVTFRPVLGITYENNKGAQEKAYYEMANPCPPYCGIP